MKHCPQRPPSLVSVALPGTASNTAALSGTTTDIVDLPGRRLSVSLNSVPSQDHHKVSFILLCNSRGYNFIF